ncbi:hypothetical protein BRC90_05390 [Halobacteriales archaeon QS_4_69_34]|nr:MAG: hypothetical protein BRC90_05390 [Halobacteriales archaeon QS_4_69_34]
MTHDDTEHGGSDAETGGNATRSNHRRTVLVAAVAVLALGLVIVAAVATAAPAAGAPTQINGCTTITQPGEYVLTRDITNSSADSCIEITASNVLLDGQGYTVDGVDDNGTGVAAGEYLDHPVRNVTVTDLTVTNWQVGIRYEDAHDGRIADTTARSNWRFAPGRGGGIFLDVASNNTLSGNTASANEDNGIFLGDATDNNTVIDNVVTGNDGDGIDTSSTATAGRFFGSAAFESTFENNTVTGNNGSGISLGFSENNEIRANTVTDNGGPGISVSGGAEMFPSEAPIGDGNVVVANLVRSSGRDGIRVGSSSDNTVSNNTVVANGGNGIALVDVTASSVTVYDYTRNNTLTSNLVRGNGENGIVLDDANDSEVTGNAIENSGATGVELDRGATANLIADNELINTDNVGFASDFAGNPNAWNRSNSSGPNVAGGPFLGGNYYASPDGTGFSQTCTDADGDGFCDSANTFGDESNNTDFLPLVCAGSQSPGDVTGDGAEATDPDCDGRFENVNGDEPFDVVDVQALFANRESAAVQNNPGAFNFNGDTDDQDDPIVDVVDVQKLFVEERAS